MPPSQRELERARSLWTYRGQQRPRFAVQPADGQESVWDYPRPPAYVADARSVEVYAGNSLLASTKAAIRALETGSPPAFYLPPEAVDSGLLRPSDRHTFCEWKGRAHYFHVETDRGPVANAVWCYPDASGDAAGIAGWYACYPSLLACFVAGERVRAQDGGFYGGWVTAEIVGPWKGAPGTGHW